MKKFLLNFLRKYKHFILIVYMPVYITWFLWLEHRDNIHFTNVYCKVDDWIPFQEIFIIPYLLWFLYVASVIVFLFFQTKYLKDFYRMIATLMLGMTTCLIIYTIWPNAQDLRPDVLPRDNVFSRLILVLYQSDTSTNVCPSIHVYNSIAVHTGITRSHYFKEKKGWRRCSLILCILICLSTLFLKQHSFLDAVAAIALFAVYYTIIYHPIRRTRTRIRIWNMHHKKEEP